MKSIKKKTSKLSLSTLLFLLFSGIILIVPRAVVLAVSIDNPLKAENFGELIDNIAKWLLNIGVPIGTIMVLWAAVLFMTSAGNDEKVTKAKKTLTWAVIGIAILIIARGVASLIKEFLTV